MWLEIHIKRLGLRAHSPKQACWHQAHHGWPLIYVVVVWPSKDLPHCEQHTGFKVDVEKPGSHVPVVEEGAQDVFVVTILPSFPGVFLVGFGTLARSIIVSHLLQQLIQAVTRRWYFP